MELGRVRGTVVATVKTPSLSGQRILLVEPYTYDRVPDGPLFAAVDLVGAGRDEWVLYVKGREAAHALVDPFNPIDRSILGIVDECTLETKTPGPFPGAVEEA